MQFGTLDFNNLVLLAIAVIGLINTWITVRANKVAKAANETAVAANTIAIETRDAANAIAIETRDIAKKTEINTNGYKQEREKMTALLDDALLAVKKNGRRK